MVAASRASRRAILRRMPAGLRAAAEARLGVRVRFRLSPATPESVEVAELVLERRGRKFLSWTEIARYNREYSSPHLLE